MMRTATTLLIVDDDPNIRRTIARWMGSHGFIVTEAGTAGEALDQMAEHAAAITVCDVGLPDRNGLWLAAQMRRQFPQTALVITTGFGIAALPSNLDPDAIGYLAKPFTKQQLLRTIDWAIEWRHEHAY
jgi:two-component system, OmpR family, KDP operon response regulator KdpE